MSIITKIWTRKYQLQTWQRVEVEICRAWIYFGLMPKNVARDLEQVAIGDEFVMEVKEEEKETHHEVTAFLNILRRRMGSNSRFVHYGVTSSDVVDTAISLQLRESIDAMADLCQGDWPTDILGYARKEIAVGKISGPVGSHATVPPEIESMVLASLNLDTELISTQVVARDHHAAFALILVWIGTILARKLDRAAAMDIHTKLHWIITPVLENVALWHERDISHSSVERIIFPQLCETIYSLLKGGANADATINSGDGRVESSFPE